jgi:hypothetical protein
MLTREDMRKIVRRFVQEELERGEEDRASRTRITENEREAIGLGLSDAFDTHPQPTPDKQSDAHLHQL